jgi:hypothetical protein
MAVKVAWPLRVCLGQELHFSQVGEHRFPGVIVQAGENITQARKRRSRLQGPDPFGRRAAVEQPHELHDSFPFLGQAGFERIQEQKK